MRYFKAIGAPAPNEVLHEVFGKAEKTESKVYHKGAGGSIVEKKSFVFRFRGKEYARFDTQADARPLYNEVIEIETVEDLEKW